MTGQDLIISGRRHRDTNRCDTDLINQPITYISGLILVLLRGLALKCVQ